MESYKSIALKLAEDDYAQLFFLDNSSKALLEYHTHTYIYGSNSRHINFPFTILVDQYKRLMCLDQPNCNNQSISKM